MQTVAFLGSHPLGETCLSMLHGEDELEVAVVVTYPPETETWWEGSVHDRASEYGYPILTLEDEERLLEYEVDYLLSVYYPDVLDTDLLDHPSELPLNLHQAELPRYRGSNVFSHAIMNARADNHWLYGTTLHVMEESVGTGDVIDRRFVPIEETDTARELYEKTERVSEELFAATITMIQESRIDGLRTPQEDFEGERYSYAKDSLEDRKEIHRERLTESAESTGGDRELYDRIRALDFPPFEPAYTYVGGEKVYLTASMYPS